METVSGSTTSNIDRDLVKEMKKAEETKVWPSTSNNR